MCIEVFTYLDFSGAATGLAGPDGLRNPLRAEAMSDDCTPSSTSDTKAIIFLTLGIQSVLFLLYQLLGSTPHIPFKEEQMCTLNIYAKSIEAPLFISTVYAL